MASRHEHGSRSILALGLCSLLMAGTAAAADLSQSLEVGGFGLFTAYDVSSGSDLDIDNGFGGGFNIGYHFTQNAELEYEFTYTSTSACCIGAYWVDGNIMSNLFSLNYNFHPSDQLIPFLKVGGGYVRIDNDELGLIDDGGAVNVGLGARFFPFTTGATRGLNLRVESEAVGAFLTDSSLNIKVNFGIGWVFNLGGGGKSSF